MVISSNKHLVQNIAKSSFESKMILTIKKLQMNDLGGYRCIAKNSLGEVDSNIRLYGKYYYSILVYRNSFLNYKHFNPQRSQALRKNHH